MWGFYPTGREFANRPLAVSPAEKILTWMNKANERWHSLAAMGALSKKKSPGNTSVSFYN
jgi:hypothetical protein